MTRLLALTLSFALMIAPASAQAPASVPVEVLEVELDVDGRPSPSVTQVSVSGHMSQPGSVMLSVVSNFVGAADRTLEAWFEQGASAPQRRLTLRLINRLGRAATYDLQSCTMASRSFVAPDADGGFLQETWTIGCATMRRL